MITSKEVIDASRIHPTRVKNIYVFGSQVYGNNSEESDWDVIMVANSSNVNIETRVDKFNIHIMTEEHFIKNLKEHRTSSVEAFFSPNEFRLKEDIEFNWSPNIASLRHSFSHISSNSWVKSKKKIEQGDYYIGVKSLFHSLRIPIFGIQIAKTGKIYDFSEANFIHDKIFSKEWTWNELDSEFRTLRNKILSDFRSLTNK